MEIHTLKGKVVLLSGLHIGGGDDTMKIGGVDNQVIKDANSGNPYIPGSSIKGKMRSLLEWNLGLVNFSDGKPFSPKCMENEVAFKDEKFKTNAVNLIKIFGSSAEDATYGITRISIGDCKLISKDGQIISESKYENVIDRKTGTANHPRQTERVPSGVEFEFDIRLKVFKSDGDNEQELKDMVKLGLNLIEKDYLGGNGSRGYGRVEFKYDNWEK